jgi:DNA invertase Pin-like site-specific DNA recombinase
VVDADVDTTTASGRLFVNVLMAMAEFESQRISERTAASHRVRRATGRRAGQHPELPAEVRARIVDEIAQGDRSLRSIAAGLNADKVPTARGGAWYASTVAHVARSVALEAELAATELAVKADRAVA